MRPLRPDEAQWLFPAEALLRTPSQEHGLTYKEELHKRAKTIDYIRSLAARTGLTYDEDLPHDSAGRARGVLSLASTLVHRFYMRRSLKDFPPEIIAPTILFIASKIEEEPLKLRHIVNQCLRKFIQGGEEKQWFPVSDHGPAPSHDYCRWERDILVMEELVHEALCFDMIVEQPWPVIKRAVKGLGNVLPELSLGQGEGTNGHGKTAGNGKATENVEISEGVLAEYSWVLLNELSLYPIAVLYHPYIIAYSCIKLAINLLAPGNKSAFARLKTLGPAFGLDLTSRGQGRGDDTIIVQRCIEQIWTFCEMELRIKDMPVMHDLRDWVGRYRRKRPVDVDLFTSTPLTPNQPISSIPA